MFAETIHSVADTTNQIILAFGIYKSVKVSENEKKNVTKVQWKTKGQKLKLKNLLCLFFFSRRIESEFETSVWLC